MIEVRGLRRSYGRRSAVDGVDLDAAPGRVLGLLGPNGAGKTTTLRVIVGALAATAGTVRVAGIDVDADPLAVKRVVGWLPEQPPLYDDLRVDAHLRHVAVLKGVDAPDEAVRRALGRLEVGEVADRLCGRLSKGWRQRVALAAALVHDPEVVVLDEPASGLDPAQRVSLRRLVRALAAEGRTVVLSSLALFLVEPLCDDVAVMHGGRVVLAGAVDRLGEATTVRVRVARPDGLAEALRALPGVERVDVEGDVLRVQAGPTVRPALARAAAEHDLLELVPESRLEEAFLAATGGSP
jgi:ABC-2 type transport system ATP-binding protein